MCAERSRSLRGSDGDVAVDNVVFGGEPKHTC